MGLIIQYVIDAVLLVLVAGVALLVLGLARELGRVQIRLGPLAGQLAARSAQLQPHERAPRFDGLSDHLGRPLSIGGSRPRPQLVLFTNPTCASCRSLLPSIIQLAAAGPLDVAVVTDADDAAFRSYVADSGMGTDLQCSNARDIGVAFQVTVTPYAVVIDSDGVLRAAGQCSELVRLLAVLDTAGVDLGDASFLTASPARPHEWTHA